MNCLAMIAWLMSSFMVARAVTAACKAGAKKANGISARGFGLGHGNAGALKNFVGAFTFISENRDSDAGGAVGFMVCEEIWLAKSSKNIFTNISGFFRGILRSLAQAFEDHNKLIRAETATVSAS